MSSLTGAEIMHSPSPARISALALHTTSKHKTTPASRSNVFTAAISKFRCVPSTHTESPQVFQSPYFSSTELHFFPGEELRPELSSCLFNFIIIIFYARAGCAAPTVTERSCCWGFVSSVRLYARFCTSGTTRHSRTQADIRRRRKSSLRNQGASQLRDSALLQSTHTLIWCGWAAPRREEDALPPSSAPLSQWLCCVQNKLRQQTITRYHKQIQMRGKVYFIWLGVFWFSALRGVLFCSFASEFCLNTLNCFLLSFFFFF